MAARYWLAGLLLLVLAGLSALAAPSRSQAEPAPAAELAAAIATGQLTDLAVTATGSLTLAATASAPAGEAPFLLAGTLIGPLTPLTRPTNQLLADWRGRSSAEGAVRLELRGRLTDGRLTPWLPAATGPVVFDQSVQAVQYRVTLLAPTLATGPRLDAVALTPLPALPATPLTTSAASFRVYATRIGLIGGRTANGHIIAPEDRFVALPSRRVLASNGGSEYQVRVEYRGSNIIVPVWDLGPWNVRDNWWDPPARRDMWNDLPTGQPQATAAYHDNYNGGRDSFGRKVLNPAGIDLSDGAYAALGLPHSDYVTVTMLWLTP
jgi:hypothetical protein